MHGGRERGCHLGRGLCIQANPPRQQLLRIERGQQVGAVLRTSQLGAHLGFAVAQPAQRLLDGNVVATPETLERRQVVRADHGHRLRLPLGQGAESAALQTFKDQRAVRQQRMLGHGLAHARRHIAQVFADHHALVAMALDGHHRNQGLQRVADVGASLGAVPVQPHQRHGMVHAQRAGVSHHAGQQLPKRQEASIGECHWIDRRQAPVLPLGAQRVGRGAHVHAPGIEAG